jgi:hypothetical protein
MEGSIWVKGVIPVHSGICGDLYCLLADAGIVPEPTEDSTDEECNALLEKHLPDNIGQLSLMVLSAISEGRVPAPLGVFQ